MPDFGLAQHCDSCVFYVHEGCPTHLFHSTMAVADAKLRKQQSQTPLPAFWGDVLEPCAELPHSKAALAGGPTAAEGGWSAMRQLREPFPWQKGQIGLACAWAGSTDGAQVLFWAGEPRARVRRGAVLSARDSQQRQR